MTNPPASSKGVTKKVPPVRRRSVGGSQQDWVSIQPLFPDRPYPTLITPKVAGLVLPEWAAQNRDRIEELFWEKRSLLFRGFELGGKPGFSDFVDAASRAPRLTYRDRSTPRETHGDKVYCSTIYPSDQTIRLHNEGTYWVTWAMKLFFSCYTNSETGGETPIGDVHRVHERIDPAIRAEFAAKKWMLVRNYNDGFGLPWQDVFQATDPAEVEAYCRDNRIEVEWKTEDRLRTRQTRPAIRAHPRTGEPLWFNHAAFFHVTSREPEVRDALLRDFAEDELPYQTFYGDGTSIDPEVVKHIHAAYEAEKIMFRWQEGDVHLIDNMRLAHARQPYTGDRLILVALTEGHTGVEQ